MREALKSAHPILLIALLTLYGFIAMGLIILLIMVGLMVTGNDMSAILGSADMTDPNGIGIFTLKLLQMGQSIGLFIAPYLVYQYYLKLKGYRLSFEEIRPYTIGMFSLMIVAAMPLINFLAEWNSSLHLPEAFSGMEAWMRTTEKEAETLIRTFLTMDSFGDLAFNLLLIAVLPAVAEEVFFRGTIQPLLKRTVGNVHLAIWLTAFLFSFFHMQFLGFFPRLLLGVLFGYAVHWTGNLIVPIIGHFINNGLAVLITWFIGAEAIEDSLETVGANEGDAYTVILSLVLVSLGIYLLWKQHPKPKKSPSE